MGNISKHFTLITILILVVVAVVLGYFILSSAGVNIPFSLTNKDGSTSSDPRELSSDEKAVLILPDGKDKEAGKKHNLLVTKLAKQSSVLIISDCQPQPLVTKIAEGSKLTITNEGDTDVTIIVDPENTFTVIKGGTKVITVDFGKGPGFYGYNCDGGTTTSGLLFVTPQ